MQSVFIRISFESVSKCNQEWVRSKQVCVIGRKIITSPPIQELKSQILTLQFQTDAAEFDILIVIGSSQSDGDWSRGFLRAIPSPMSRGLVVAIRAFKRPAIIYCMVCSTAEPTAVPVLGCPLPPMDLFFDDNFLGVVFVGRDIDNSSSGIS